MEAVFPIYLWGIYDNILSLLTGIGIISISAIIVLGVIWILLQEEFMDNTMSITETWLKRVTIAFVVAITLSTFIPSKNVVVMMYAAPTAIEALQDITDSNRTQTVINILDNSLNYLETKSKELK